MSVTFKNNSKEVLATMQKAKSAALIKVGIAAKHNIQDIIIAKDIYETGELHRTIDWGADGIIGKIPENSVDVGSPKNYAIFNELGGVRNRERPFVRPGIMDNMDEYKGIVADVLGDAFSVSAGGLKTTSKYYQDDERVTNI